MAELFGVTVPTINYHLGQIEQSGEIHLSDAIRKILIPSDKWVSHILRLLQPSNINILQWCSIVAMIAHKAAFDAGEVEHLVILVVVILGA